MKILKHRNLLGCLFAFILAMPLIQVGVRCAYTIFNKNAYESYSQNFEISYKYETNDVTSASDIEIGNIYTFTIPSENTSFITYGYFSAIYNLNGQNFTTDYQSTSYLGIVQSGTTHNILLQLPDSTTVTTIPSSMITYPYTFNVVTYSTNVSYTYLSKSEFNVLDSFDLNENSFLDNAFEYSINRITEGNNIGDLHFFTWFADLFLDLDNSANALYINFINWYFNYALLVSVVYILFLVLMWFIQFVRKLLEKGMDFGQRGY